MQLRYAVRGAIWVLLYLLFILAPLFTLLAGSMPPRATFWTEFSVAIGYAGLAMMGLQFGLTARFRYVTDPWGEDVIYHFHRQISLIAVGLVVAHPLILFVVRPELLALLNSIQAPWRARFAALSIYSLIALVVMALVAREAEYQLRNVAPHPYRARGRRRCGWAAAHGGVELLPRRPLEARAVDRPDGLLDRAAALRAHRQAAVHAPPAVPVSEVRKERGDTTTLVMQPDGHAGFRFRPGQFGWLTVWGSPVQDHRAPVLVLVQRRGYRRPR